jgi:phage baseplate assembly protein W
MAEERAISLPFSFTSAGEVGYTTDLKKIIQDRVVLAVMTKLQERVMRPNFGSDVYDSLFENQSTAESIVSQAVSSCFASWFPYLSLRSVKASLVDESLEFNIYYSKGKGNEIEAVNVKTSLLTRAGDTIKEISNGK